MAWQECVGALHVHSRYSDGTGSVEEILRAGKQAGLDHLVLTDHDTLAARREGWEGAHDGLVLLVAAEVTPRRQGHVVAMKVRHCRGYAAQQSRATLDGIAAQGGFAVIAHPMGKYKPSLMISHTPWYEWRHPAVRGMEIWSYMHDWVDGIAWWRLPAAYEFWKHPQRRVRGPEQGVLDEWDRQGRTRRIAGLGGLDCHARKVPLTRVQIFAYDAMFQFLRNHLFVPVRDSERDPVAALWDALAEGRGFVAHDALADSTGTRCTARLPDGRAMQMGEEAAFGRGTVITLTLPRAGEVRWIADGRCRLTKCTERMDVRPAGPGVYRFEVRLAGAPWIFTNPFYLR